MVVGVGAGVNAADGSVSATSDLVTVAGRPAARGGTLIFVAVSAIAVCGARLDGVEGHRQDGSVTVWDGAQLGGSIYDLAAPLYGYDPRGEEFLRLRADLGRLLGLETIA